MNGIRRAAFLGWLMFVTSCFVTRARPDIAAKFHADVVFTQVAALQANSSRTVADLDLLWWQLNPSNNPQLANGAVLQPGLCAATVTVARLLFEAAPAYAEAIEMELIGRLKNQLRGCMKDSSAEPPGRERKFQNEAAQADAPEVASMMTTWAKLHLVPLANWREVSHRRLLVAFSIGINFSGKALFVTAPELVGYQTEDRGYRLEQHGGRGDLTIRRDVFQIPQYRRRPDRVAIVGIDRRLAEVPSLSSIDSVAFVGAGQLTHNGASVLAGKLVALGYNSKIAMWRWVAWADRSHYPRPPRYRN